MIRSIIKNSNKARDISIMIILCTVVVFLIAYLIYRENQYMEVARKSI